MLEQIEAMLMMEASVPVCSWCAIIFGSAALAVTYIDRSDPGWNIFRMAMDGGTPAPVTHITEGRIVKHAWSPDGRRLGILVRDGEHVDLWVTDAAGQKPIRVTQISPEIISAFHWMADSRKIVVEAATRPSDVVLIKEFR